MIFSNYQLLNEIANQLWGVLESAIQYLDNDDQETVMLAFTQMVDAHGEQRRKSGEFYIVHPVSAALMLTEIRMDRDTVCACLLHDVPEDTDIGIEVIQQNFGSQIAFLVAGVTKLGKVKYQGDQRYAENIRRMFVAMSQDIRVIFIKLADRIHNLKTLEHVRPDKAIRIARESLEIYAPISERLGIGRFRSRIEDLVFPVLFPEEYEALVSVSDVEINKRTVQLESMRLELVDLLAKDGINYISLKGRAKRYYSIYSKMTNKKLQLRDINDLVALRVIVDSVEECYQVLALIHREFDPVGDRIKDYIQLPKPNGYQSIHVCIKDRKSGVVCELQIRTQEMHEYAQYGVASHWSYKEKGQNGNQFLQPQTLKWIEELVDLGREQITDEEYLSRVRLDLFRDRIFVLTPKGDVIDLPEGATTLDFAYRLHEELGSRAVMAKVNGQPVKLMSRLKSGDLVEILTDKKQQPKPDWLNYITTTNASRKIRSRLRKLGYKV